MSARIESWDDVWDRAGLRAYLYAMNLALVGGQLEHYDAAGELLAVHPFKTLPLDEEGNVQLETDLAASGPVVGIARTVVRFADGVKLLDAALEPDDDGPMSGDWTLSRCRVLVEPFPPGRGRGYNAVFDYTTNDPRPRPSQVTYRVVEDDD